MKEIFRRGEYRLLRTVVDLDLAAFCRTVGSGSAALDHREVAGSDAETSKREAAGGLE